ncbi:cytochrome P450 [Paraliomyxa miuraensis]|uniref:cytochrome P450 n=1 Tax=Paraliomyxa miuraensis TaxID=376150 RepID=UPI00224EBCBB|nr:cytochrome P450 [Paraliomyxa miuraensis]MCX4241687.1 cytochrome P450 [Paraliomyxa miuraensis]
MPDRPRGPSIRLWSTYQVLAHPMSSLPRWFQRYGDPLLVPTINGNVVMTGRPELVKQIFASSAASYSPFAADGIAALTGPRSVFQLRDVEHRRHRRLIMPSFHGARMRAYAEAMRDTTRTVLGEAAGRGTVRLHDLTQRISLEVIIRAVFGVQEPQRVQAFATAITTMVDAVSPSFLFMPFLQREMFGVGPYARFRRTFTALDEMLRDQIARSRRGGEGQDVLSMLLHARDEDGDQLDDDEIRDELRTLLFAGHETTAIALCWAVDAVGRHPDVARRLQGELLELGDEPEAEAIAKLPYLEAVCNESLRLYPIVTEVLRNLHQPMELGGYSLRPPTAVSACILEVHRNPTLYPEPHAFRPERFLDRKYGPHEFLPFGGGHRRCIGAAFASFELRVVLGTLLREFEVALLDPSTPRAVRRNVTMAPEGGVPVTLVRARPGSVRAAAA